MSTVTLRELVPLREWQANHVAAGGQVFRTFASLEWFVRRHREPLVSRGALIPQRGSRGSLVTPAFDSVVLEILCG